MSLTSQVTMAWNGSELFIEAANPTSGAREKIAGVTIDNLPLEIQMTLRDNLRKAEAHRERYLAQIEAAKEENRVAREREINAANEQAAREADLRWAKYISGLSPEQAAEQEKKRAARILKSRETAQEIYKTMASTPGQGVALANKVIEPGRRPRRIEMTKNGNRVTYYPRTDDTDGTKKAKKQAKKSGAVVYEHVDTKSFVF